MTGLDLGFAKIKEIFGTAAAIRENITTEEDAKLQIINRVLIEALGWDHKDISAERKNANGFSDYIVSDLTQPAFVVEAKRSGRIPIGTQATKRQEYKISGPALKSAFSAIEQAASYCAPLGIQLAVLTDGHVWIVFKPYIAGAPYFDKQAFVFPSFGAVQSDFAIFYELLSKENSRLGTYKLLFDKIHENRLFVTQAMRAVINDSDLRIEHKSALAFDLDQVFSKYFSTLEGQGDEEMAINCFVETNESRVADFSLEKITANVLGNIVNISTTVDESLKTSIVGAITADVGETVFIVGPTGAGKTTFLDRFFKRTLSKAVRELCVIVKVNALDASGDDQTSVGWMTNTIIKSIERQLFENGNPEWNDLQALYQGEYVRRSIGVDAILYNRDKDAFKEKFGLFMDQQVEKDREGYLTRLLQDIVRNRKKLPILVIDNTDEFSLQYKETLFQYCQSLRRGVNHCLLIFPVTDKSAWAFSKADIFNIYSSKSFFLPTPPPREVFRKRVDYLKGKLTEIDQEKKKANYFVGRGIKLNIGDLAGFASVVENIFVDQDYAAKRIGDLANYNIRKTLTLSKRVITSAHIEIEEIIKSYATGHPLIPDKFAFMNALLKGDYNAFRHDDEHYIFPIYQADDEIRQSPLIHLRILLLLRASHKKGANDEQRYLSVRSIFAYFDLTGMSEAAVEKSVLSLMQSGLIEPYDLASRESTQSLKLAITYSGLAHLEMAISSRAYNEQMAISTRIANYEVVNEMESVFRSPMPLAERMSKIVALFVHYLDEEDRKYVRIGAGPELMEQRLLGDDLVRQWASSPRPPSAKIDSTETGAEQGLVRENTSATVEFFDATKGFGFVTNPEMKERVFLHQSIVVASGLQAVHDGDDLRCDVSRGARGLYISKIHEILKPAKLASEALEATIVRLFPDRGYGFVRVSAIGGDALFYYSLLSEAMQEKLKLGLELRVNVKSGKSGLEYQVKQIVDFEQSISSLVSE